MVERDVTIDATWKDSTSPGVRQTTESVQRVSRAADRSKSTVKRVAEDWGRGFDRIGAAARRWADGGDGASRRWTAGALRGLAGLSRMGGRIASHVSSAVEAAGPHVKVALVGMLAAAAVAATPALAAALVGGAAGGGIVGGLLIASRDVRVKAALSGLGDDVTTQLQDAAAAFVPATVDAVTRARLEFQGLLPDLRRIFDSTAGLVGPLVSKIGAGMRLVVRGIADAVERAGPVVDAIGDTVVVVSREVGQAFRDLSDNGESMALALRGVGHLVASSINLAATAVNAFTEAFELAVKVLPGGERLLRSMSSGVDEAAAGATRLSGGFQAAAEDAEAAAAGMTKVREAADQLVAGNLSLRESQIASREAIRQANATIEENGRRHGLATAKGRENERQLIALARAFNAETEAGTRSGLSADKAAAAHRRNKRALEEAARAAGYTEQQVADLVAAYLTVPAQAATTVRANGAVAALTAIQRLRAEAERFDGSTYTATARLNYVIYGKPKSAPGGLGIGGSQFVGGAAGDSDWMSSRFGDRTARTGGPVEVTSDVAVSVLLDGAPFYAHTERVVAEHQAAAAWRARTGRR